MEDEGRGGELRGSWSSHRGYFSWHGDDAFSAVSDESCDDHFHALSDERVKVYQGAHQRRQFRLWSAS